MTHYMTRIIFDESHRIYVIYAYQLSHLMVFKYDAQMQLITTTLLVYLLYMLLELCYNFFIYNGVQKGRGLDLYLEREKS